jgi:hypothetical protein
MKIASPAEGSINVSEPPGQNLNTSQMNENDNDRSSLLPFIQPRLLSDAESGEIVEQSNYVEEPHHHANYDDSIQDRLDGTSHRDEPINQP